MKVLKALTGILIALLVFTACLEHIPKPLSPADSQTQATHETDPEIGVRIDDVKLRYRFDFTEEVCGYAVRNDGWVYYNTIDRGNDVNALYKIREDGTENTKLIDEYCDELTVIGDWIYYVNENESSSCGLYKIRTDGTKKTRLNNEATSCITLVGDWIYYINDDDNHKIYKMRTDGTEKTRLNKDNSYIREIEDDWIYYTNYSYDYGSYKMKTDGSERQEVKK